MEFKQMRVSGLITYLQHCDCDLVEIEDKDGKRYPLTEDMLKHSSRGDTWVRVISLKEKK